MVRKSFTWDCVLQRADGQMAEVKLTSFWSPEKDNITSMSVANAAAAMATVVSGQKHVPISGQLRKEEPIAA